MKETCRVKFISSRQHVLGGWVNVSFEFDCPIEVPVTNPLYLGGKDFNIDLPPQKGLAIMERWVHEGLGGKKFRHFVKFMGEVVHESSIAIITMQGEG